MTRNMVETWADSTPTTWKQITSNSPRNRDGQPQASAEVPITARWDFDRTMVLNVNGQALQSNCTVIVDAPVTDGDFLNDGTRDWLVYKVQIQNDVNGTTLWRECIC